MYVFVNFSLEVIYLEYFYHLINKHFLYIEKDERPNDDPSVSLEILVAFYQNHLLSIVLESY